MQSIKEAETLNDIPDTEQHIDNFDGSAVKGPLQQIRKTVITLLMVSSLIAVVGAPHFGLQFSLAVTWSSSIFLTLAIILYSQSFSSRLAFTAYFLGIMIPIGGLIVEKKLQMWQWILAAAVSILLFGADYFFKKHQV